MKFTTIVLVLCFIAFTFAQTELEELQDYNEDVLSTTGALPENCAQSPDITRIQFMIDSTTNEDSFSALLNRIHDHSLKLCLALKQCEKDKSNTQACSMGELGKYMTWSTQVATEFPKEFTKFNQWNLKLKSEGK
jgi:hypothetical protein